MKTWPMKDSSDRTIGLIVVLESMQEGIDAVNRVYHRVLTSGGKAKATVDRDGNGGGKMSMDSVRNAKANWDTICSRLKTGSPGQRERIEEEAQRLRDVVLELDATLATGYRGFERNEAGCTFLPELAFAGEERCFLRRKRSQDEVKPGKGDGAYRVTINTDVCWRGDPTRNAAVLGAVVMLLQNFGPVEIWIQQGWVDHAGGELTEETARQSGVTLFKLECDGRFEPAHLAFWTGDKEKDSVFSLSVNKTGLGRTFTATYRECYQPTDIYLAGTWSDNVPAYNHLTREGQDKAAAEWIVRTVRRTVFVSDEVTS